MGVMIRFASPYTKNAPDVVLGPFKEASISDCHVYGNDGVPTDPVGYYDHEQCAWSRDGVLYDEVKIFAASDVVGA